MDFGLFLLSGAALCFGVPAAVILWLSSLGDRRGWTKARKLALLIVAGCFTVWGWTYKVHFLDEALVSAAREGDLAQVKTLLHRGANPNAHFEIGTPLRAALNSENQDVVDAIWAAGGRDRGD